MVRHYLYLGGLSIKEKRSDHVRLDRQHHACSTVMLTQPWLLYLTVYSYHVAS